MNLRELIGTEKKRESGIDRSRPEDPYPPGSHEENVQTPDTGSGKKIMELSVVITLTDESQIGRSAWSLHRQQPRRRKEFSRSR